MKLFLYIGLAALYAAFLVAALLDGRTLPFVGMAAVTGILLISFASRRGSKGDSRGK